VSIIAEIAQRADVSVEGVLRVLTREPVSEDIKQRVLSVLPDLSPEQTRVLQRFALAALHDELPRQESEGEVAVAGSGPASTEVASSLAPVLGELVEAIRDLRREANAERRERVDDLAVLVDVMTTGWQGLDRRLGRVETMVGRIDSSRRPAPTPAPLRVEQPPREPPREPPAIAPPVSHVEKTEITRQTRRWPVAAALVAGLGIGLLAGLDVLPARTDIPGFGSDRESASVASETTGAATAPSQRASVPTRTRPAATTTRAAAVTTQPSKARRPTPKPAPPAAVDSVLGTIVTSPKPTPPTSSTVKTPPASATTQAPPAKGFTPARKWGWSPVAGADYYVVEFFRAAKPFYRATATGTSLQLPDSVVFRPGAYRWVVRPGFGQPAAKRLGAPTIDSAFEVAG
jgi:hypothetical protein